MALPNPRLSPAIEPIFFFLLLGFQHSESIFHSSIIANVSKVLKELVHLGKKSLVNQLGEAVRFLIDKFPGFPELYSPVITTLNELEIPSPSKERIEGTVQFIEF